LPPQHTWLRWINSAKELHDGPCTSSSHAHGGSGCPTTLDSDARTIASRRTSVREGFPWSRCFAATDIVRTLAVEMLLRAASSWRLKKLPLPAEESRCRQKRQERIFNTPIQHRPEIAIVDKGESRGRALTSPIIFNTHQTLARSLHQDEARSRSTS
jgi:hypothetical protein